MHTHSYKYLGVIIDDKLKWHDHITDICRKIFKFSGLFYKIRRIATTKILLVLYYALVQGSATPGTRAKCGTRADFLWHTK